MSVVCVLSSIPSVYSTSESKLLCVLKVKGMPGVLRINVYVCPLNNFNDGFCVLPSGENTYAVLSRLSSLVTVNVLSMSLAWPATPIPIGPFGNQ